ncbi:MAG: hypothetical protein Kow0067_08720 [Coriobacteriia bacterium]
MTPETAALIAGSLLMALGALGVLLVKEAMRLVIALGGFLLGVALLFGYFAAPFLAVAQVFVYVGGVLVLFLFALMVLRRGSGDVTMLATRHDAGAAVTAAAVFGLLVVALVPESGELWPVPPDVGGSVAADLLGPRIVPFELAGLLLLVALVAVLVIVNGGDAE